MINGSLTFYGARLDDGLGAHLTESERQRLEGQFQILQARIAELETENKWLEQARRTGIDLLVSADKTENALKADLATVRADVRALAKALRLFCQYDALARDNTLWIGRRAYKTRKESRRLWFEFRAELTAALARPSVAAVEAKRD